MAGVWTFQQKLIPTGANARMSNDQFGTSVAISGDYIVVGAPYQDYNESGASAVTNAGAIYVFKRNSGSGIWAQEYKITTSGTSARITNDSFGWSVAISGDTLAASSPWQDYDEMGNANVTDAGSVFVYKRNAVNSTWAMEKRIVAQGSYARQASDLFGYSVSLHTDTLAVGVYGQDYDATGASGTFLANAGAAFVYFRTGSSWTQQARITPTNVADRVAGDQFGIAVSIFENSIAIGSNFHSYDQTGSNMLTRAGAVFIYIREPSTGVWSLQQKLVATGTNGRRASDYFGQSVSIGQNTVAIGAPLQDWDALGAASVTDAGAVFIFTRNTSTQTWSLEQKMVGTGINGRVSSDQFGAAVTLGNDSLLVGVKKHDYDDTGAVAITDAGSVFTLNRSGSVWSQLSRLSDPTIPSLNRLGSINSAYGSSMAISEDHSIMVIGAPASNIDSTNSIYKTDGGLVFVYESQNGLWTLQQKLTPTGTNSRNASDGFGTSVAISGTTIVVGSPRNDFDGNGANAVTDAGAAFVFVRDSNNVWSQEAKLVATGLNARVASDLFGSSVGIRNDRIVIGVPGQNYDIAGANNLNDAGAIFLYLRSGTNWNQDYRLSAPTSGVARAAGDQMGFSVAISQNGDYIATGAPYQDTDSSGLNSLTDAGATFIFRKQNDQSWAYSQKLVAIGTNARVAGDRFGYSVSMDTNRLAVGSPYHDYDDFGGNLVADAGAIFIFYRSSVNYTQEQKVAGSTSMSNSRIASDTLGFSVAISGDVLVGGAPGQDFDANGLNSLSNAGAAYAFVRSSGLWAHQQRLVGFGTNSRVASDEFGRCVALFGPQLSVGARYNDYDSDGTNYLPNSGAAFIN